MSDLESAVQWRQWSVAVVLALLVSVFVLSHFHLAPFTPLLGLGCGLLALSLGLNLHLLARSRAGESARLMGGIADGLLLAGLIFLSFGVFF